MWKDNPNLTKCPRVAEQRSLLVDASDNFNTVSQSIHTVRTSEQLHVEIKISERDRFKLSTRRGSTMVMMWRPSAVMAPRWVKLVAPPLDIFFYMQMMTRPHPTAK
jgi:hypothetical protein